MVVHSSISRILTRVAFNNHHVPILSFPFARGISSRPPPRKPRNLDMMAPFRPPPSSTQLQDILHQSSPRAASSESGDTKSQDAFETTSTSPAGSSLQDVSESTRKLPTSGTKVVEPVPAMKDVVTSSSSVPQDEGRRKKEMIVMGVAIPPKPVPPGEEECCMSGCINCVYTIYSSELEEYTEAITAAQSALEKGDVPFSEWPEELKKGKGEDVRQREEEKKEVGMDASMSAFLALENKLKKKQAPESSSASA